MEEIFVGNYISGNNDFWIEFLHEVEDIIVSAGFCQRLADSHERAQKHFVRVVKESCIDGKANNSILKLI